MRAKQNCSSIVVLIVLAFSPLFSFNGYAQCYLGQGCKPVDDLTYLPNGTGQVYHGDGASNNGNGGWTTIYSDVNQCLSCHYGTDTSPYVMSGHKNTLRKLAPGALWGGPDGAIYRTTDDHYASGSVYDWTNGNVTLGWCDPIAASSQNGLGLFDPRCQYPYYTLANSHAPTTYTPIAPTVVAGGIRNIYYVFGGWQSYGGSSNPANTELGTIFNGGSTGNTYPNGNFDCARCHVTGYNFDASAPEPTQNTNNNVGAIPDSQFSRIPTDGYIAPGTTGTSSWYETGIQCERCHVAAWNFGSHPYGPAATQPQNEAATALCMECHRGENITMANNNANPPAPGSIMPSNAFVTLDHGYCSDLSGSAYAACLANPSNAWVYKPYIDHEAGQAFLNSPHARFSGTLSQNTQHSPDLSISISGTYQSPYFSENPADLTKNSGCTGCHDPHKSTVSVVNSSSPFLKNCTDCHSLSANILSTINHPQGPGTPFPTGTSADIPGSCAICHMVGALGTGQSHLFRINPAPNYRTFPTPDQLYNQNLATPNMAPEISALTGNTFSAAAWVDVDLACGQCHVGNDGVTNSYGLTMPLGLPGSHAYTRAQLSSWAMNMHAPDNSVPTPTFTPPPATYYVPESVTILDTMSGATIHYTTDGSTPTTSSAVYSTPIPISSTTWIRALATYPGYPSSNVALGVYPIVLPQAGEPAFKPPPSTYSTPQSVSLLDTAGLSIYYTTDGSIPTTSSTQYTGLILVSKNTTINAIAAGGGYLTSSVAVGKYSIQSPNPTFSLASGTYYGSQSVILSDAVSGASIYYTTDGSFPSTSSTSCSNPCTLAVSTTTVLKAIAAGGGYVSSNVAVATYTIEAKAPTFSPGSGTYSGAQTVTLTDTTSGAIIYYTLNGTLPTTSSNSCPSPCTITVSTATTIEAVAVGMGVAPSNVAVSSYTIDAATPTFSPGAGSYGTPLTVTLSDATNGATIYYTTNGNYPTTASASCSSPCSVTISTTGRIYAIATANGYGTSAMIGVTYSLH